MILDIVRVSRFERRGGRLFLEVRVEIEDPEATAVEMTEYILRRYRDEIIAMLSMIVERCLSRLLDVDLLERAVRRAAGRGLVSIQCGGSACRAVVDVERSPWPDGWGDEPADAEELIEKMLIRDRAALGRVVDCVIDQLEEAAER